MKADSEVLLRGVIRMKGNRTYEYITYSISIRNGVRETKGMNQMHGALEGHEEEPGRTTQPSCTGRASRDAECLESVNVLLGLGGIGLRRSRNDRRAQRIVVLQCASTKA